MTDSRFAGYRAKFGEKSWELDAVSPDQLVRIIQNEIRSVLHEDEFTTAQTEERDGREMYVRLSENWEEAERLLRDAGLI